jgi:hypothetical protein
MLVATNQKVLQGAPQLSGRGRYSVACLFLFFLASQPAFSEETRTGIGLGALSLGGYVDLQLLYQPDPKSPWVIGLRYLSGTERFDDPFTGNALSDDEHTVYGLSAFYLFNPQKAANFYVGAGIYRQSLTVTSLVTGERSTDSAIAPYIGGGYISRLGSRYYYNIGVMLGLGSTLKTKTSVTEDEETGIDPQLIIGVNF